MPWIKSPFKNPEIWQNKNDCLFLDSDEATMDQINFITKMKKFYNLTLPELESTLFEEPEAKNFFEFRARETIIAYETEITIPKKFEHVDLKSLYKAETRIEELLSIIKKVHPWSSLHYGFSALDVVRKLQIHLLQGKSN